MNITSSPYFGARGRLHTVPHYLWLGLAASLGMHALLMAWPYLPPARIPLANQSLAVSLVNVRTDQAPLAPTLIAQQHVDGGGTERAGTVVTPLPHTGPSPHTVVLEALRKSQAELEAEQQRLLTRLQAKRRVAAQRSTADAWTETQSPGHAEVDQDSVVLNAQIAALAERIERDSQALRRAFIAPSAMQTVYAAYVDAWRTRIENVGTRHFPAEARGGRGETLRLTVTLTAEGHVLQTHIDRPARNPALNLAARRIVQLAAPFPPFPPELASTTKRLTITRNWHFLNDTLDTSAP